MPRAMQTILYQEERCSKIFNWHESFTWLEFHLANMMNWINKLLEQIWIRKLNQLTAWALNNIESKGLFTLVRIYKEHLLFLKCQNFILRTHWKKISVRFFSSMKIFHLKSLDPKTPNSEAYIKIFKIKILIASELASGWDFLGISNPDPDYNFPIIIWDFFQSRDFYPQNSGFFHSRDFYPGIRSFC